jgi:death on curing protein
VAPLFLTLDEVLSLHEDQIEQHGGASGVRDVGLLQSAIGSAKATFDGAFLHTTLFEMAGAYLFGICRNHPFVDGNKRTAVAAALTFLEMNRIEIDADEDEFYELVIAVASGKASKSDVAVFLQTHAA